MCASSSKLCKLNAPSLSLPEQPSKILAGVSQERQGISSADSYGASHIPMGLKVLRVCWSVAFGTVETSIHSMQENERTN